MNAAVGLLKKLSRAVLFSTIVSAGVPVTQALADSFDLWRSSESTGHYLIHDYQSDTWVETIDCRVSYNFKLSRRDAAGIQLHDASRNLYVYLDQNNMWLYPNGVTAWSHHRKGGFDHRVTFSHVDATGGITGTFWKKPGCRWNEHLGGTATPDYRFVETAIDGSGVTMYDSSRNLYVYLSSTKMYLRRGVSESFAFFKNGQWDR